MHLLIIRVPLLSSPFRFLLFLHSASDGCVYLLRELATLVGETAQGPGLGPGLGPGSAQGLGLGSGLGVGAGVGQGVGPGAGLDIGGTVEKYLEQVRYMA